MSENPVIPQIKVADARVSPHPLTDSPNDPPMGERKEPDIFENGAKVEMPKDNIDPKPKNIKQRKILFIVLGVIGFFLVYFLISGFIVYKKAIALRNSVNSLVSAGKSQDINQIKKGLTNTQSSLNSLSSSFVLISWMKFIPLLGSYVSDAGHAINAGKYGIDAANIVLTTVEPYSDLIGLKGGSTASGSGEKTAKDRIDFIVKSIPDLVPKVDQISAKTTLIEKELNGINPDRYPVRVGKTEVRSKIKNGLDLAEEGATFITNSKPLLESAPYLLGIDKPRTYLVIFQNDKELRPTGGFITAYSIMKVDNGKFSPVTSSDIYSLDAAYKPSFKAPDPVIKYIKGPYALSPNFRLRDMNWSPDFAQSMNVFTTEAAKVGVTGVDGVISVDTQVLVYLLDAIGQIGVPGFGNFGTSIEPKCNCANVIYQLESFADIEGPVVWDPNGSGKIIYAPANYDNRKKIIGPLMNSILANAMGQPKDKLPKLFDAAFKSLTEKHVLFYLFDSKVEDAVSTAGIGGTIKQDVSGDYLHINDANLGGRKSNLYVTQEVESIYSVGKDGYVEKTLVITYKNPEKQDGWLNSVLPDWLRVYVPKGSQLLSFDGVSDKADPYEDLGKTVFAGFFELRPEGEVKITLKYKLPFKSKGEFDLLIQKQPGTDTLLYRNIVGKSEDEFYLKADKALKIRL